MILAFIARDVQDMGERGAILKACRLYGTFKQNLQDSRGHMACLRSDGKHSGLCGVLPFN